MNGYQIGEEHAFFAETIDLGGIEHQTQDADLPGRDGRVFGRDTTNAGAIVLTLVSLADDTQQVMTDLDELTAAWEWEGRRTPGAYTYLAWESGGRTGLVYGRPRKIAPEISGGALYQGGIKVVCEFLPVNPDVYSGIVDELRLVIKPSDPTGLLFPAEAPFLFLGAGEPRQGQIVLGGSKPAPFEVAIRGPIANPWVSSTVGGWRIEARTTVAYDQTLVIDTLANTATIGGRNVSASITRNSNLNARLRPGVQEVLFGGTDETLTASATFKWMAARTGY